MERCDPKCNRELGAQPHKGLTYFIDFNSGLWITRLGKPAYSGSFLAPPR